MKKEFVYTDPPSKDIPEQVQGVLAEIQKGISNGTGGKYDKRFYGFSVDSGSSPECVGQECTFNFLFNDRESAERFCDLYCGDISDPKKKIQEEVIPNKEKKYVFSCTDKEVKLVFKDLFYKSGDQLADSAKRGEEKVAAVKKEADEIAKQPKKGPPPPPPPPPHPAAPPPLGPEGSMEIEVAGAGHPAPDPPGGKPGFEPAEEGIVVGVGSSDDDDAVVKISSESNAFAIRLQKLSQKYATMELQNKLTAGISGQDLTKEFFQQTIAPSIIKEFTKWQARKDNYEPKHHDPNDKSSEYYRYSEMHRKIFAERFSNEVYKDISVDPADPKKITDTLNIRLPKPADAADDQEAPVVNIHFQSKDSQAIGGVAALEGNNSRILITSKDQSDLALFTMVDAASKSAVKLGGSYKFVIYYPGGSLEALAKLTAMAEQAGLKVEFKCRNPDESAVKAEFDKFIADPAKAAFDEKVKGYKEGEYKHSKELEAKYTKPSPPPPSPADPGSPKSDKDPAVPVPGEDAKKPIPPVGKPHLMVSKKP